MFQQIVARTNRVPVVSGTKGDGSAITRQLDVALMEAGFKLSKDLITHLSDLHPVVVKDIADKLLATVREMVGDHVQHNTYFRDFPENVPNTVEFWLECIFDALLDPDASEKVSLQLSSGVVNLLDLPKYGRYQHSYEEMVAAHEQFIPSAKDRVTVLHLGKTLPEEAVVLYHQLAGSSVPANDADRMLLAELAKVCLTDPQPEAIPVRENKAIINQVRLENGQPLLVDTVTDVLRLACALSYGDVTLVEPTHFKSLRRSVRRALMEALNLVVSQSPEKLSDVNRYTEPWKRLGERLHPHEYKQYEQAQAVFAVARGDRKAHSLAAKVEIAFADSDVSKAIKIMSNAPGMLFRSLDRILRTANEEEIQTLLETVQTVISKVSGRVILSVREHLQNRTSEGTARIFANSKGTAYVTEDTREPLQNWVVEMLMEIFDEEILKRLPDVAHLVFEQDALSLALPLSEKNKATGFGIMSRGSVQPVTGSILRFFMYWKQRQRRTDYDLSALMLDDEFGYVGQVSWTRYSDNDNGYAVYSGDLTEATNGASEFIDIELGKVGAAYIIPQVNVYSGEAFSDAEDSFFGFMERSPEQKGKPFEAQTVRMKSEVRGKGKVALPLIFAKDKDGNWTTKWLHLYLNGKASMNRVEENRVSTALLARTIFNKEYLNLEYLVNLLRRKAETTTEWTGEKLTEPVTFIGIETPENLPEGSVVYTLNNLTELIPA